MALRMPNNLPTLGRAALRTPSAPSTSSLLSIRPFSSSTPSFYNPQRHHRKKRAPMYLRTPNSLPRIDAAGEFKTYVPHTPGIRHLKRPNHPHLYNGRPIQELTIAQRSTGGRNVHGHRTTAGRGGGHKRRIRLVDTLRKEPGEQEVIRIEYDPGRSGHIALLRHKTSGNLTYIVATDNLRAGDVVESYADGLDPSTTTSKAAAKRAQRFGNPDSIRLEIDTRGASAAASANSTTTELALNLLRQTSMRPGNLLKLKDMPNGASICNLSLRPSGPAKLCKAAGTASQLISIEADPGIWAHVKLPSGEVRKIHKECTATVGKVSNATFRGRNLGKAGRNRWLGRRPKVRGMAQNPVDHPHGGGKGKQLGNRQHVSPTGVLAKGGRTRRPGPRGNRMVLTPRPRGLGKSRLQNQ